MDLDELRSVRRTERQKDSLQHLRDSFYGDVADFIAERKARRKRAADAADDPFSDPEVGQLTDEIETAEDVVEAIYERRVGKVVKLASFAAADMSADTNGLTAEERDLFDDLVTRIKRNRETVLDVLAGERAGSETTTNVGGVGDAPDPTPATESPTEATPADADAADDTPPTPPDRDPDASPGDSEGVLAEAMGGVDEPGGSDADQPGSGGADEPGDADADQFGADGDESNGDAGAAEDRPTTEASAVAGQSDADGGDAPNRADGTSDREADTDRVTLRITSDVGQILGVDEREYDLAAEDVVTLPTTNADPLVERGAAERLD